jgi:hypothetical protein
MVVGKLLRLAGHGEHDDASYIPDTKRHRPRARVTVIDVAEQFAFDARLDRRRKP